MAEELRLAWLLFAGVAAAAVALGRRCLSSSHRTDVISFAAGLTKPSRDGLALVPHRDRLSLNCDLMALELSWFGVMALAAPKRAMAMAVGPLTEGSPTVAREARWVAMAWL
eukprot:53403-Pelagomonas_calceolata.AAC.1